MTCGDDETDALATVQEAVEPAVEHRVSHGEEIPQSQATPVREVTVCVPAAQCTAQNRGLPIAAARMFQVVGRMRLFRPA